MLSDTGYFTFSIIEHVITMPMFMNSFEIIKYSTQLQVYHSETSKCKYAQNTVLSRLVCTTPSQRVTSEITRRPKSLSGIGQKLLSTWPNLPVEEPV